MKLSSDPDSHYDEEQVKQQLWWLIEVLDMVEVTQFKNEQKWNHRETEWCKGLCSGDQEFGSYARAHDYAETNDTIQHHGVKLHKRVKLNVDWSLARQAPTLNENQQHNDSIHHSVDQEAVVDTNPVVSKVVLVLTEDSVQLVAAEVFAERPHYEEQTWRHQAVKHRVPVLREHSCATEACQDKQEDGQEVKQHSSVIEQPLHAGFSPSVQRTVLEEQVWQAIQVL